MSGPYAAKKFLSKEITTAPQLSILIAYAIQEKAQLTELSILIA
jgi:hypothetical protein